MRRSKTAADPSKRKRKGSPEVEAIFKSRNRAEKDFLSVYWRELLPEMGRGRGKKHLFLVVSKRILPLAHQRNRAKRLVREIYRQFPIPRKEKYQMVVRISKKPEQMTFTFFQNCLESLFCGVFK